jgi:hypothetical protein
VLLVSRNLRWAEISGVPAAFASYQRREPLAGASPKSIIMQFAKGDMTATNPEATATLRAGELADRACYFRNGLAFAANPYFVKNPYGSCYGLRRTGVPP